MSPTRGSPALLSRPHRRPHLCICPVGAIVDDEVIVDVLVMQRKLMVLHSALASWRLPSLRSFLLLSTTIIDFQTMTPIDEHIVLRARGGDTGCCIIPA